MRAQDREVSLGPVMTFMVAKQWIAVRIAQMDKVAVATKLWPVPWTQPGYLGLLEEGHELVPVLQLAGSAAKPESGTQEYLVAILHVRGESVGMVIDRAGLLCETYELGAPSGPGPMALGGAPGRFATAPAHSFWLIDTDQLWHHVPPA